MVVSVSVVFASIRISTPALSDAYDEPARPLTSRTITAPMVRQRNLVDLVTIEMIGIADPRVFPIVLRPLVLLRILIS